MLDLSLHILDIVENSINAGAQHIQIDVEENLESDRLVIQIRDDGRGIDEQTVQNAADPFVTKRRERSVRFGLPFLLEAARRSGGRVSIESAPLGGAQIKAEFQHSHIDRQPLGDMGKTLLILTAGHPHTEFFYRHVRGADSFTFSSPEVMGRLQGRPITSPEGIVLLRRILRERLPSDSPRRFTST